MHIAFCYESVFPARGGCSTYIADLARRLVADGQQVHLFASRWDPDAIPEPVHLHRLPAPRGPRWLRPWLFGAACLKALRDAEPCVSIGFDKTWGQDVLYPQGGLHAASADYNLRKFQGPVARGLAKGLKWLDLAHWSYRTLERRQYLGEQRPLIVVNSEMVRRHFQRYYGVGEQEVRVVYSAIDPDRFAEQDRLRRRGEWRERWGVAPEETVGLFAAMNYRLKGLEPLLRAVRYVPAERPFRLAVVGDSRTGKYERLARQLGVADRVLFLGYCADMRDGYFGSDFLVHPTFYDPCSLVVLEALACGLPVVTSKHNGASELLDPPREGYVVADPHDQYRLAWCMTQLLDSTRRHGCAQAARKTAMQWTFEHHYRQLLQVFAEAAARKRAA
jgi:UDP-glucose:(heptosyl)LPS alpha-1,3-glucosyltransferase